MKTIILMPSAAKYLDALPRDVRTDIEAALADYAVSGRGDIKPLSARGGFRMRVGRYRVVFDEDKTTILPIYIGKRETSTYRRH